jgi:hypothetical protein
MSKAYVNQAEKVPRVGYIAGYGRSGSTVFDIVLGGHPEIFGAGELTNLSRRVWPNNEYCSCGAKVRQCPFWSTVVGKFVAKFGSDALTRYTRLQKTQERLDQIARTALTPASAANADYAQFTLGLLSLIAEESGKAIVMDSSKLPGRAVALSTIPGLDVRIIHLVRDGRAVAWSMSKAYEVDHEGGIERRLPSRSASRTALRWSMVNVGAEWVARRVGPDRAARLHYETFVTQPAQELRRVGKVLGVDTGALIARLESGNAFDPGHVVAGSRWRMNGPLKLRLDQDWRNLMPARQKQVFQLISGWLQRRYGY